MISSQDFRRWASESDAKVVIVYNLQLLGMRFGDKVENVWILANAWINLEKAEKSAFWYEKVLCIVKEKLGENHELYADALVEYTDYYEAISDFIICEKFYD